MLGDTYTDHGLVFTTDTDASLNPSNMRQRSFARLLRKADLPHIRFHDLRHTCATLLLSKGTHPKFVQELLGHATIAITLDTYSHVMPSMGTRPHAPCRTRSILCRMHSPKSAALVSGWCQKGVVRLLALLAALTFYLQTCDFFEWAMLGSNQR